MKNEKLKDLIGKMRGSSLRFDLSAYEKILVEINGIDLNKTSKVALKNMSLDLFEKARGGIPLNDLLVEAFALVREVSRREIDMRHFDVQIIGGIALHQKNIIEMQTGEGKTLVAVLPAYLNALTGHGVHILTFNDYLARRDAAWMDPVYRFLGLSVGCIQEGMSTTERQQAYASDIIYATATEAGFDYLRDHLCHEKKELVHRPFHYSIVDEADSILIDEARVPMVIAGVSDTSELNLYHLAELAKSLRPGIDYNTDEEERNVYLTDSGIKHIESTLFCGKLHDPENLTLLTEINCALHAEALLRRDVDYIVRKEKIEIIDEFTGRVVEDRHWPDGLQAAVEAKEKLSSQFEGSILGSITLQHFMQLYPRLCGMTATAQSAAEELKTFYDLDVTVIPPNKSCIREDLPDVVFTHKKAKEKVLIEEIKAANSKGRPILVGTSTVKESEKLAASIQKAGISCQILNAKNDEMEAQIIAQAGAPGAVTISTNMAGRGTDIKLGGDREQEINKVISLGGLYVIGTNRHESLRIDFQLRGRAGRQGDPGSSCFFISLEDDLISKHGIQNLLPAHLRNIKQDTSIVNPIINRELARGQRIIEGQNFDIRKTLWKYSSIVEKQRKMVQERRQNILFDKIDLSLFAKKATDHFNKLKTVLGEKKLCEITKNITLFHIDKCWAEHLGFIANVRESIHLVKVGGEPPINEFHRVVSDKYRDFELHVEDEVICAFKSLPVEKDGLDSVKHDLKGPSSTWTYLINDNQFGNWVKMIGGQNIGFTAGAALYTAPLFLALRIHERYFKKKK